MIVSDMSTILCGLISRLYINQTDMSHGTRAWLVGPYDLALERKLYGLSLIIDVWCITRGVA